MAVFLRTLRPSSHVPLSSVVLTCTVSAHAALPLRGRKCAECTARRSRQCWGRGHPAFRHPSFTPKHRCPSWSCCLGCSRGTWRHSSCRCEPIPLFFLAALTYFTAARCCSSPLPCCAGLFHGLPRLQLFSLVLLWPILQPSPAKPRYLISLPGAVPPAKPRCGLGSLCPGSSLPRCSPPCQAPLPPGFPLLGAGAQRGP